jgi:hypothetical protein
MGLSLIDTDYRQRGLEMSPDVMRSPLDVHNYTHFVLY